MQVKFRNSAMKLYMVSGSLNPSIYVLGVASSAPTAHSRQYKTVFASSNGIEEVSRACYL